MLPSKLILDRQCLVLPELLSYADRVIDTIDDIDCSEPAILVLSRITVCENSQRVIELCHQDHLTVVFDGCAEGSMTLMEQVRLHGLESVVLNNRLLLIGGGDMLYVYPYIRYDYFISVFTGYPENIQQMQRTDEVYAKKQKPYKFLFLNGRARPARKYLWHKFNQSQLLDHSIWTMLDAKPLTRTSLTLFENGVNLIRTPTPIRRLPDCYEVKRYRGITVEINSPRRQNIKHNMFANTWGDVCLQAEPYIDTYFSVVTETVAEHPWSFRTEKIVKPLAMGHPWICSAGPGFYRDLRDLGFRTFDGLIDESFDQIDNFQDRLDRIHAVVQDLCQQDLASFLDSCYSVCKYNQQHLLELSAAVKREFPSRFFEFLKQHRE